MNRDIEKSISEESVVQEIMQMAGYFGIVLFRVRERIPCARINGKWQAVYNGRRSTAGLPDLHGYITSSAFERYCINMEPGKSDFAPSPLPIYIEVKRPIGGRVRTAQTVFIERARKDGVPAFIARSWREVVLSLKDFGFNFPEPR